MKILVIMIMLLSLMVGQASAHTVFAPEGKKLKIHWAVLQAKPGKMSDMAAISVRTVAKSTPKESGTYSLYGTIDAQNPDIMRLLEIYEDEDAYAIHTASDGYKAFVEERKPIFESLKLLPVDPIVLEQKKNGTGKFVLLTLFEVKSEKLDEFKSLIVQEFTRAVAEDSGVLGMFATSEQGNRKNFVHTMEIFTDSEAHKNYTASEKYKSYRKKADTMTNSEYVVENKPANITLSEKGLHLSPDGQPLSVFPLGKSNDAYAQYFDGKSYLAPLSLEQVGIFNVTFEPGCRNHWHIHHAKKGGGQILIVVSGRGWYQEWGKPAQELKPGDVVNIPANVKHWHGAAKDSWFQHLAVEVSGEETSNEWCEAVSPEEYAALR